MKKVLLLLPLNLKNVFRLTFAFLLLPFTFLYVIPPEDARYSLLR